MTKDELIDFIEKGGMNNCETTDVEPELVSESPRVNDTFYRGRSN